MNDLDQKIILALADCNMNTSEASRIVYMHRNSILYHCSRVKKLTGLDPLNFYDLHKLVEMIRNGVTVQEWISVKDRLPEDPLQTVLVTNGKETCVAVYSVVYDEFGVMCGRGQDMRFGVTHWMPLPQPPKGE